MAEGLVRYKGKWVEINKKKLAAALEAFERASRLTSQNGMTIAEAMRMELTLGETLGDLGEEIEVSVSFIKRNSFSLFLP